jgi:hypothetical protein
MSAKKLRESALHEAMRSISKDAPNLDGSDLQAKSTDSLSESGADVLSRWSKSHERSQDSAFTMPSKQLLATAAVVSHKDPVTEAPKSRSADNDTKEQLRRSALHEAMRSVGGAQVAPGLSAAIARSSMASQSQVPPQDAGQGLMDTWSKAHPDKDPEKQKRKFLVDMYPPTPAPDADLMALAMARGFGKKVALTLEARESKQNELHEALHKMGGTMMEADAHAEETAPHASAATGADILSRWSKTHR